MDFEKMAREIVERVGNGDMCSTSLADFVTRDVFQSAIADALRAAATVPDGYVRVGTEDMRLLGELTKTKDGAVCGNMFSPIWCIHRGNGNVYNSTIYHAGVKGGYSTREAAEAAREKGGEQ